jgi:Citrate transporter
MRAAGASRLRLIGLTMIFVAVLTALISVDGAVAALLPVVIVMAVRLRRPTSQLLMPMVFGAHCGSMLALTGTPVNVLVYEAALDAGREGFGYFEFALVGVPLLIGGIAVTIFLGERLLPFRESKALPPDLSTHARTLIEQFSLTSDVHQLRVREESPLVGTARAGLDFADRPGISLVTLHAGDEAGGARIGEIHPGDTLIVRGEAKAVGAMATELALSLRDDIDAGQIEDKQTVLKRLAIDELGHGLGL